MTEVSNATRIGRYIKALSAIVSFAVFGYLCSQYTWLLEHGIALAVTVVAILILVNVSVPVTFTRSYEKSHAHFTKLENGTSLEKFCLWGWYSLSIPMSAVAYFMMPADGVLWYLRIALAIFMFNVLLGLITLVRFYANKPPKA